MDKQRHKLHVSTVVLTRGWSISDRSLFNISYVSFFVSVFLGVQLSFAGARVFLCEDGSKCWSSITTGGQKQLCQSKDPYLTT
jgi:hypothetical protein